jgi:hypothetical protein
VALYDPAPLLPDSPLLPPALSSINVTDRNNLTARRQYILHLPQPARPGAPGVNRSRPLPLVLYFHGQGVQATDAATGASTGGATDFSGVGDAQVGLGRNVTLYYRSSTSYQMC